MNQTLVAAESMLGNGWFTASRLGKSLGISAREASGLLYNIRNSSKYKVKTTGLPNRKVMVLSINGRTASSNNLWNAAIFGSQTRRI